MSGKKTEEIEEAPSTSSRFWKFAGIGGAALAGIGVAALVLRSVAEKDDDEPVKMMKAPGRPGDSIPAQPFRKNDNSISRKSGGYTVKFNTPGTVLEQMAAAAAAEISIVDHELPDDSHNLYDVNFFGDVITTVVTHDPTQVAIWVTETLRLSEHRRESGLNVGFDVEWLPYFYNYQDNPVAVLQLCVDRRCLVFQILRCVREGFDLPAELRDFLGNPRATFVGVEIKSDVEKLVEDYDLSVRKTVDLQKTAAEKYGDARLKKAGMKTLAGRVLGREMEKLESVRLGKWDNPWLDPEQVQYACLDAFVAAEIATKLAASDV